MDAVELGLDRTVAVLRQMLTERFGLASTADVENPLFSVGMGLTSLEGIEFLGEIERQFGVQINDLDWWVYETPTLANVAQYLIDLSKKQHASQSP